jgi:hypothetical protein
MMTLGVTVASRTAEAFMLRNKNRSVAVVVVEGPSDSRTYRKVLADQNIHIAWLNGKSNALELLEQFNKFSFSGVVGIVDADEDRYLGRARQFANVCWTSKCDLESMVIASDAYLRRPITGLSEEERRTHIELLVAAATPVGCIRLLSKKHSWALDFKDIVFGAFIDSARISCEVEACCQEILARNLHASIDKRSLGAMVAEMQSEISDPFIIVNGHDLCKIAHLCTLRMFRRSMQGGSDVFASLVEYYESSDFASTTTYAELLAWQATAAPYVVTTRPQD